MAWFQDLARNLGTQNAPFGFAPVGSPSQGAVDPAYNAGMDMIGNIGMGMLASGSRNPLQAFGRSYLGAQEQAQEQNRNQYVAAEMMSAAEEKKQKRQQEADQKAQFENWVKTLPPDQQGLARMFPDKYGAQMVQKQFPDQQGGNSNYGMSVVPMKNKRTGELAVGQLNQGAGGVFINGEPVDSNEWSYDPGALSQDRAEGTMIGGAPKSTIDNYTTKVRPEMASISDTIVTLKQARTYLQKGIQTGSMSDKLQALRGLGAQLGFNVDETILSDTQSYQNFIGNVVIPRMAALGGNDSNEELKKLYSLSGGDINQSLSALSSTLDFIEKLSVRKFKTLKAQEDVALRYIPGLTPVPLGGLEPAPQNSGAVPDFSTMTDEQLEAIANGNQ